MEFDANPSVFRIIDKLGPWFHNFHLPGGVQTAPHHFLGDFPLQKWKQIEPLIPLDLTGWSCLDIGCNAGFYSFELAKRGAQVLGIDSDEHYLKQAKWISEVLQPENPPSFKKMQIHHLSSIPNEFDLILFMGVFYHLRYPTLALDTVAIKTRRLMIFQTLTTEYGSHPPESIQPEDNYSIDNREIFQHPGWPKMAFIEKSFSDDPTNWWVPNHSAVMALLRSTGFEKIDRVAHEIYFCFPPKGGVKSLRDWNQKEWKAATGVLK